MLYFPDLEFQKPSFEDTKSLLEDGDFSATRKLWDKSSGYKGLLDAKSKEEADLEASRKRKIVAALLIAYFIFREDSGIYQYGQLNPSTGIHKPVTAFALKVALLRLTKTAELEARSLGAQLVNGTISVDEWYFNMESLLKSEYEASWILANGGIGNVDFYELQHFSQSVGYYFEKLGNLAERIARGELPLNGHIVGWSGMYARAGNSIYWNASMSLAQRNGMREAKRILGPNENHCLDSKSKEREGCRELAAKGWLPIDQMVPLGDATCLSNCLCGMSFRR